MKGTVISISGKGGSGKTTLTALLLRTVIRHTNKSVLVADADPAANIADVIGIKVGKTVGMMANRLKGMIEKGSIPPAASKHDVLEAWVYETIVETPRFDLLVMGRTEGEGCYCFVNSVLRRILDVIVSNYDLTLMDMEAGLEHISRRMDRDVDIMIIVTDPSRMGLRTVGRIRELIKEVHVNVNDVYVVGNMILDDMKECFLQHVERLGVKPAGVIPMDDNVALYNMTGRSLLELPDDSPAVRAVDEIAVRIGIMN